MRYTAAELAALGQAVMRETERRACRSLAEYTRRAWSLLESAPFSSNWHIDLICEHLEALYRGEITNLLLGVPPGTMKSLLSSVMLPTWAWAQEGGASKRFFSASYGEDLSTRDAVKSRNLIDSAWYQRLWGDRVVIARGQDRITKYENTAGGWRLATSVGGRGTGEHPDFIVIDDPHNVRQSVSDAERKTGIDWYDLTLSSRGITRDVKTIVAMQRLHQKDLAGHIIDAPNFARDWVHLCLPMRFERGHPQRCKLDPRTQEGELLWPTLYTPQKVETLEIKLGDYGTASQLQQRPSPAGGGILKMSEHLRLWPSDLPLPDFELVLQSYDTAYTKDTANDPTACTVYAVFTHAEKRHVLVVDAWADHMEYPVLRDRVIDDWQALYGGRKGDVLHPARRPDVVLVEDKGSGKSLVQDLQRANVPATKYDPLSRDKISRAHQVAPILEMGIVWVLESKKRPGEPIDWVRPLIVQAESFPNADHDDLVDTFTQALIYLNHSRLLDLDRAPDEEPEEMDYHANRRRGNPYGTRWQ